MTNYKDTNDAVHHLRFLAEQAEIRDEEAAFQSFEEHFKTSAEDPYFENELKLWLTAWRKALAYFTEQVAPVRRAPTTNNNADPVRSLVDRWREGAELFTSGAGFDIRETLIDCADELEAALAQQKAVQLASTHCDNCGCEQPTAGDEVEYEVWQGDVLQAGGRENDYASAKSEAHHYAMMYVQDGPVEVRIYEKRLLSTDNVEPKRRRYDPNGSLSEYGVFPESDAQVPVAATLNDAAADPALTLETARELLRDAAAGIRRLAAPLSSERI